MPIDPFDINKPISSKLDIENTNASDAFSFDMTEDVSDDISPSRSDSAVKPVPPLSSDNAVTGNVDIPNAPKKVSSPEKAAQMPAVGAEMISVQPANQEQPQKVNLAKPEKAAQMPAVKADGNQPPVVPWKSTDDLAPRAQSTIDTPYSINARDNRADENRPLTKTEQALDKRLLGKGTVSFAMSDTQNIIFLAVSLIAVLVLAYFLNSFISFRLDGGSRAHSRAVGAMVAFLVGLFVFLVNIIRSGEHWSYVASGREIIFSRKGRASYIIFYKDVLAVDYRPYKFLGLIETGYTVNVLTYGKRYEFRYVYPNPAHKISFEYTPFEIIRSQIDQLGINN